MLLSLLPPRRGQDLLALVTAVILFAAFLVTLSLADVQVARLDVFVPITVTMIFLNNTLTSTLLLAQFAVSRAVELIVLAASFLYIGVLAVVYALLFPGAFSLSNWLGAGPQSAIWLFMSWHFGFPVSVIAFALLKDGEPPRQVASGSVRLAILTGITYVLCVAAEVTRFVTVHHEALPALLQNGTEFSPLWIYFVNPGVAFLWIIAIVLLGARRRSLLDLWLLVVAWTWLLKTLLLIFIKSRFSVAWYAHALLTVSATTFVLIVLLSETTMMYARLALSITAQRREREGRLLTMDAVTASIAHEINQPLAAIVNNGSAALRWLSRAAPDICKASEAVKAVVDDGHRAGQVIAGVRAMFRQDEAEKRSIDINDAVMEVLRLAQGDLLTHGIAVDTALDSKLPLVSANKVQLQQVLLNLLGNAIEAMDGVALRPRQLHVSTQRQGQDVLVTVVDTGHGIDPKDRDRIFEPLFTTKSNGMGLGLAICRSILAAHGGRIWATPGFPCGTVFQFALRAGDPGLSNA